LVAAQLVEAVKRANDPMHAAYEVYCGVPLQAPKICAQWWEATMETLPSQIPTFVLFPVWEEQ
jgi:hypothetical protein